MTARLSICLLSCSASEFDNDFLSEFSNEREALVFFFLFCLIFDADCYDDFNLSFSDSVGTGTLDFESVFNYSVSIFVFIGRFAAFIDFHITS